MFKRINCSLITALAVATSAVQHIRNPLFTRSLSAAAERLDCDNTCCW